MNLIFHITDNQMDELLNARDRSEEIEIVLMSPDGSVSQMIIGGSNDN